MDRVEFPKTEAWYIRRVLYIGVNLGIYTWSDRVRLVMIIGDTYVFATENGKITYYIHSLENFPVQTFPGRSPPCPDVITYNIQEDG